MSKLRRGLRDARLEHTLECTVGKGRFGGEKWSPRYAVYNTQVIRMLSAEETFEGLGFVILMLLELVTFQTCYFHLHCTTLL